MQAGLRFSAQKCDVCGGALLELHCKLMCTTCGFTRDCSDP